MNQNTENKNQTKKPIDRVIWIFNFRHKHGTLTLTQKTNTSQKWSFEYNLKLPMFDWWSSSLTLTQKTNTSQKWSFEYNLKLPMFDWWSSSQAPKLELFLWTTSHVRQIFRVPYLEYFFSFKWIPHVSWNFQLPIFDQFLKFPGHCLKSFFIQQIPHKWWKFQLPMAWPIL